MSLFEQSQYSLPGLSNVPSDPATLIAGLLILTQLCFATWLVFQLYMPLVRRRADIRAVSKLLPHHLTVAAAAGVQSKVLHASEIRDRISRWTEFAGSDVDREDAMDELEREFQDAELLPTSFSARLDAAAPGMFVAIGIFGTFIGLISAFLTTAHQGGPNVGALMQTMIVPFANSAIGVLLAILLTLTSRGLRHGFEQSCVVLRNRLCGQVRGFPSRAQREARQMDAFHATIVEIREIAKQNVIASTETVGQLGALSKNLAGGFETVVAATSESSKQLVAELAPKLEESMRKLVDAPFTELTATINTLDSNTKRLTERQVEVVAQMQAAGAELSSAQSLLAAATSEVAAQAKALELGSQALTAGTEQIAIAVKGVGRSTDDLRHVQGWVEAGSSRLGELLGMLENTHAALSTISDVLATNAARYDAGASGFNEAVAGLRATMAAALDGSLAPLATELRDVASSMQLALQQTIVSLRDDMEKTARVMASTIEESSTRTINAYSTASAGVNNVLEDHMDGVVDRLNGQLGALQRMVPDEVSRMTQATVHSAKTLEKATKQLEAVVGTVNEKTTLSLRGQLDSYNGAVTEIHERLHGTLALWETRAESLENAVLRLANAVDNVKVA